MRPPRWTACAGAHTRSDSDEHRPSHLQARSERTGDAGSMVPASCGRKAVVRSSAVALKPLVDLVGVEAHEVADLVVGDGSFGDHAPDVADAGRDVVRDAEGV